MSKKKYVLPLIISIIIGVIIPIFFIIGLGGLPGLFKIIPINSGGIQGALLIWVTMISAIIGVLLGYIIVPVYIFLHKKIFSKNVTYAILDKSDREIKSIGVFKALFPALMAMSFALSLSFNSTVQNLLIDISADPPGWEQALNSLLVLVMASGWLIVIPMTLFSGCWFLMDAGIIYSNKKKVENTLKPIEVHSIGGKFKTILKGYAGIGVLISYYSYLTEVMVLMGGGGIGSLMIIFLWPFLLALWCLPALILIEITRTKRNNYISKYIQNLEPIKIVDIELKAD